MSVIRKIRVKNNDGTFSEEKHLGALAENVKYNERIYDESGDLTEETITINLQTKLDNQDSSIALLKDFNDFLSNNLESANSVISTNSESISNINNTIDNLKIPQWKKIISSDFTTYDIQCVYCEVSFYNKVYTFCCIPEDNLITIPIYCCYFDTDKKYEYYGTFMMSPSRNRTLPEDGKYYETTYSTGVINNNPTIEDDNKVFIKEIYGYVINR